MKNKLLPLFDSLSYLHKNAEHAIVPAPRFQTDFTKVLAFLNCYTGSEGTFNSYRREAERLLQWCWLINDTTLKELKREAIEKYIKFCQNPPNSWIGLKKVPRFIEKEGHRQPNPEWRPFVAGLKKMDFKQGKKPSVEQFSLSQGAVQEILAILSTLFNFLISEEYLYSNPVALIRQKSKFVRKVQHQSPVRRLSIIQWKAVMEAADSLASESPEQHERTRFMLTLLFGMYLRISELAANERWTPSMNHFAKDSNGYWWFTTVGKGNKERQIAVSEAMLTSLTRWRLFLGLPPLPSVADTSPLIPKIRGNGPMSNTAPIRRIIQKCFDLAEQQLLSQGLTEEASNLSAATVHWLRHTGISEDVKIRPREHVRDDAGHSSSATTDRYIDIERQARYKSALKKTIEPERTEE